MTNPVPTITISIEESEDILSWYCVSPPPPEPGPPGPEGGWWTVAGPGGTLTRFRMPPLAGPAAPAP